MSPYELISDAISKHDTFRSPDISEAANLIDSILIAAGEGSIRYDEIEDLSMYGGSVHIDTRYTVRGCSDSQSYSFPISILEAADPIKAATIWGLNKKISKAMMDRDQYAGYVANADKHIAEFRKQLESL